MFSELGRYALAGAPESTRTIVEETLDDRFDLDIPLGLMGFGPKDARRRRPVVHTFFTEVTLQRCVQTVRDPGAVTAWSVFATIPDTLRLMKTVGRPGTYLQMHGDLLVRANRRARAVPRGADRAGLLSTFMDAVATTEQLELGAGGVVLHGVAPVRSNRSSPPTERSNGFRVAALP